MITVPTIESQDVIDLLVDSIRTHLDLTGESKGEFAKRAGLRPEMLSRLLSNSYTSSPTLEICKKIADAVGKKITLI